MICSLVVSETNRWMASLFAADPLLTIPTASLEFAVRYTHGAFQGRPGWKSRSMECWCSSISWGLAPPHAGYRPAFSLSICEFRGRSWCEAVALAVGRFRSWPLEYSGTIFRQIPAPGWQIYIWRHCIWRLSFCGALWLRAIYLRRMPPAPSTRTICTLMGSWATQNYIPHFQTFINSYNLKRQHRGPRHRPEVAASPLADFLSPRGRSWVQRRDCNPTTNCLWAHRWNSVGKWILKRLTVGTGGRLWWLGSPYYYHSYAHSYKIACHIVLDLFGKVASRSIWSLR